MRFLCSASSVSLTSKTTKEKTYQNTPLAMQARRAKGKYNALTLRYVACRLGCTIHNKKKLKDLTSNGVVDP